jgi:hypothetical protein
MSTDTKSIPNPMTAHAKLYKKHIPLNVLKYHITQILLII